MARSRLYPPSVDPGFPALPPTPVGWKTTTFGDVVEAVQRPVKLAPGRTYRLLTAKRSRGGIVLRNELKGSEILTKTQFEAQAGDFLISRRQIIHGACGIVPDDLSGAVVSNEYSTLRTRDGLLMDFLRHYAHSPYFQRTCFHSSHGVDVEKMVFKLEQWLKWRVDLPPLPEQRKIAAILTSVDEVIEKTQAVIEQLQVVKKAMMAEFLTRGIPGRHKRFKKTEIGEIPEEWQVAAVDQLLRSSTYGVNNKLTTDPSGIPVLRMGNINDSFRLDLSSLKYAPADTIDLMQHGVEPGDVLFNRTNSADKVGKVALVETAQALSFASYLVRLRANDTALPRWLFYALASPDGQKRLKAMATKGVSQVNISPGKLRTLKLPIPPIAEQRDIAVTLESVDRTIERTQAGLAQLQVVKTSLTSVLLTGEVRVTPDEGEA